MIDLPTRLTHDAIHEAVLEIRFEQDLVVPEILYGSFVNFENWKGFRQSRLPGADLPAAIRKSNEGLRYQRSIGLTSEDGGTMVQIGPEAMVYSRRGFYPGWNASFSGELESAINHLWSLLPKLEVNRIGLRYINALRSALHGIKSIEDLNLIIKVDGKEISDSFNLNFITKTELNMACMTRVSTVDLAQGAIPEDSTVLVDIDVYTKSGFKPNSAAEIFSWVQQAHVFEKENFFRVLGKEATERLREI